MSVELKIKSKHLTVESKIIRFEEQKLKKQKLKKQKLYLKEKGHQDEVNKLSSVIESLSDHRRKDVRNENRSTFLARAYLSGKPYRYVEAKTIIPVANVYKVLSRALVMINKYGPETITLADLIKWTQL